ncbi:hypothetical protein [Parvicella tangerina]|uniref:Uncharacterized protein n=1 Tax=Parvicella tangerina TaxID=2829795 RepID=A0A916NBK3_9FLAO|nr:hypothetical protein [Parvicella tangerina]CAG5081091.1 hypothetical protein CRYO30217_01534 [Parvicella tangerina]
MSYNTIAYMVYTVLIIYITVVVGYQFHKNGIHFILMLQSDTGIAHALNNLLLVLYYCLNIGYSILIIYFWESISSLPELIYSLSEHTGYIILGLGIMHYLNLTWIYLLSRKNINQINH